MDLNKFQIKKNQAAAKRVHRALCFQRAEPENRPHHQFIKTAEEGQGERVPKSGLLAASSRILMIKTKRTISSGKN